MKALYRQFFLRAAAGLGCIGLAMLAHADTKRVQTLQLHQGWNSVYLEIAPTNSDPGLLFTNSAIDVVATHFPADQSVEFVQNPGTIRWNKDGWGVWYAPRRPDAFLSTLFTIFGHRSFLIHAEQECTLNIVGKVSLEPVRWKSDSFNHVGFGLDAVSPPTFQKFFGGSPAHRNYRIYRLIDDKWSLVLDPVRTFMRSGEAYWVYCTGGSDYQGPLSVQCDTGDGLAFLGQGTHGLTFANNSLDPMSVTAQLSDDTVPLRYVAKAIFSNRVESVALDLPPVYQLNTLEPGGQAGLRLQAKMEALSQTGQSTLLKISTDGGVVIWVPVGARRQDIPTDQ